MANKISGRYGRAFVGVDAFISFDSMSRKLLAVTDSLEELIYKFFRLFFSLTSNR